MIYFVKNPAIIMVSFLPYIFVEYNCSNSTWWVQYNIYMFSINILYPLVGSFTNTCVTAPISFPPWMTWLPLKHVSGKEQHFFILLNYPLPLPLTIHRLFLSTVPPYAESNLPRFQDVADFPCPNNYSSKEPIPPKP